jgi:hypothetical protein
MSQPRFYHQLKLPEKGALGGTIIKHAVTLVEANKWSEGNVALRMLDSYRNGDEFIVCQYSGGHNRNTVETDAVTLYIRPVLDTNAIGFKPGEPYKYVYVVSALDMMNYNGITTVEQAVVRIAKHSVRTFADVLGVTLGLPSLEFGEGICVACMEAPKPGPGEHIREDGPLRCTKHGYDYSEWLPPREQAPAAGVVPI